MGSLDDAVEEVVEAAVEDVAAEVDEQGVGEGEPVVVVVEDGPSAAAEVADALDAAQAIRDTARQEAFETALEVQPDLSGFVHRDELAQVVEAAVTAALAAREVAAVVEGAVESGDLDVVEVEVGDVEADQAPRVMHPWYAEGGLSRLFRGRRGV